MAIEIVGLVLKHGPKDQGEKLVLVSLANYADEHGVCWPKVETVRRDASCSRSSVFGHLKSLKAAGWLQSVQVKAASGAVVGNRYRINVARLRELDVEYHAEKAGDGLGDFEPFEEETAENPNKISRPESGPPRPKSGPPRPESGRLRGSEIWTHNRKEPSKEKRAGETAVSGAAENEAAAAADREALNSVDWGKLGDYAKSCIRSGAAACFQGTAIPVGSALWQRLHCEYEAVERGIV